MEDIHASGLAIQRFAANMSEVDYGASEITRRAVEREFEIIGEALRRIAVEYPETIAHISSARQAIDFRNVLSHGYDVIEDSIVWSIVVKRLPTLLAEVEALMAEEQSRP